MSKTSKYLIYHMSEPDWGLVEQPKNQPRKYVGSIEAQNEENAFELSNNIDNDWHPDGIRSTSVGDVIYSVEEDIYFLCEAMGWGQITEPELGCEPYREPGVKPDYLWFEGHRYQYSDELAAQIMQTMPSSISVGWDMTLEQAAAKFGDPFVLTGKPEDRS